ncbi:MAG: chalcone isomerase family protein [Candidatus Latescibacterota bacterium]|nr:MAG: chalcone isomerase family protein [Candidatus Latescibacterota bacterium]
MKPIGLIVLVAVILAAVWLSAARSQNEIEEPSTKKRFPASVEFQHGGRAYQLTIAGVDVRKKVVFKVYAIAHYMDKTEFKDINEALDSALSDAYAKQITMDFARDVDVEKIQDAYHKGFEKNATDEEAEVIEPFVSTFVGYFTEDVKENDRYVLRWLPDGVVLTLIKGEEKAPIENVTFARVLWRIWLGEKSIVDRKDLVELIVTE